MMAGIGGYEYSYGGMNNQALEHPTTLKLKYETPIKNNVRVKAVCFHPEMSWVLIALHNGVVQIWDYDYAVMYDEYEAHLGPCRAVDFHPNQPIFCTGGDDYLVKVFNYKKKQLLFELSGHLDYVRSVQFHHEYPWIVSASDDHMITIWNWQSRSSVAVLTGHSHYVMSARFHPTEDFIVSSSLDTTVRMWDISKLRQRVRSNVGGQSRSQYALPDDYKVHFVMTGHSKGVNWADFHPTMPYVVSGGDDKQVCVFQYTSTDWCLKSSYKSHFSNVGMVCFHPTSGYILSASEDNTVRVFPGIDSDGYMNEALAVHRKDGNRFWSISCHPSKNIIAVGHDSGTQVLKLNRERVAAHAPGGVNDSRLYVIRNNWITVQDFDQTTLQQSLVKVPPTAVGEAGANHETFTIRGLKSNPLTPNYSAFIVSYQRESDDNAGPLLLVTMTPGTATPQGTQHQRIARGAAFVSRNRVAILEMPNVINVYDTNMTPSKKIDLPTNYHRMYFAGSNRVFLRQDFTLTLFDLGSRQCLGEITVPPQTKIQEIIFDSNQSLFAVLVSGNIGYRSTVVIGQIKDDNPDGEKVVKFSTHHDSMRVKSGAFNEHGAFIYSTYKHTKYILPWGDHGVTQSWPDVVYIHRVAKGNLCYLDRNSGCIQKSQLDTLEMNFKIAIHYGKLDKVAQYVKNSHLCGSAILGHLKRVGYPEVALSFISDPLARFNLALSYGNISEAKRCADLIDTASLWSRLAEASILHGKYSEAEAAYQRQKDFGSLIHLYTLTGNTKSLKRLMKPLSKLGDTSNLFYLCLLTGASKERSSILSAIGMHQLAEVVQPVVTSVSALPEADTTEMEAWNIKFVPNTDHVESKYTLSTSAAATDFEVALTQTAAAPTSQAVTSAATGGDDFDLDLDDDFNDLLEDMGIDMNEGPGIVESKIDMNTINMDHLYQGASPLELRMQQNPNNATIAVQSGQYESALDILRKIVGIKNIEPFHALFTSVVISGQAYTDLPGGVPFSFVTNNNDTPKMPKFVSTDEIERLASTLEALFLANAHDQVILVGREILAISGLLRASDPSAADLELIQEKVDYVSNLLQAARLAAAKALATDEAAKLTLVMLEISATILPWKLRVAILKSGMQTTFKAKNFLSTAEICRRAVAENEANGRPTPEAVAKILSHSETQASNAHPLAINATDPYVAICANSLDFIQGGRSPSLARSTAVICPLCDARALPQFCGQLCGMCNIAELGLATISTLRD